MVAMELSKLLPVQLNISIRDSVWWISYSINHYHAKLSYIFLSNLSLDYYIANFNDLTSITLNIDGKKKFQKGPKVKKEIRFCLLIFTELSSYLADARQQLSFLQISNIIVHRKVSHSRLVRLGYIYNEIKQVFFIL